MHEASTTARDASGYVPRIAAFLTDIGLAVEWGDVPDEAFLPGVLVIRNGLRIDHVYVSPPLAASVVGAIVDRDERKGEQASDHAPVLVEWD